LEAKLSDNEQAQASLQHQLEAAQKQLQVQQESSRAEQARLEVRIKQLEAAQVEVEQQVMRLTETLGEETRRREGAEQQAGEIGRRRSELEAKLSDKEQAQARLQHQLEAAQKQLQVQQESSRAEQARLEARIKELLAAQVEVEAHVKRLTETLAEETRRREGAEQQADEIGQRRNELEAQLADNKQAQAQLRRDLEESQNTFELQRQNYIAEQSTLEARTKELEAVTNQLASAQSRIQEESQQRRKLVEKLVEVEYAKAELCAQADAARSFAASQENSIRLLDSQVRERQAEVDRLGAVLQSEIAQRRQEQSRVQALDKQATELTEQLAEKVAEQQRSHQRESELEECIRQQTNQLANSAAAATVREAQLNSLRSTVADLRVIQSALCAQVRELTTQHDAASRRIHELDGQSNAAARTIQVREQELAALRHSILDAARIGTKISFERHQVESQVVDGWKRLITTLLHTPLSMAQRGLIAEIVSAFEAWRKGRTDATNGVEFQVELASLSRSEFSCAEVIECALAAARKTADETGAQIQTTVLGPVPERAHGNAQQIHQLITLLTASLADVGRAENLELQVSFEAKQNGNAGMLLSLLLSSTDNAEALCLRLRNITEASATLRAVRCGGPELALSSAWQLALALGGIPSIETTADGKVRVQISLPLPGNSSLSGNETGAETN
jgi:chromosome segregation ATPase